MIRDGRWVNESDGIDLRRDRGFSTLEVLVCLVILSAGLLPLMDSQLQLQRLATRLEQVDRENAALTLGLRYMRDVNPGITPSGRYYLGSSELRWNSRLAAPDTFLITPLRGGRNRNFGLFDVRMDMTLENGTEVTRYIRLVGWNISEGQASSRTDARRN